MIFPLLNSHHMIFPLVAGLILLFVHLNNGLNTEKLIPEIPCSNLLSNQSTMKCAPYNEELAEQRVAEIEPKNPLGVSRSGRSINNKELTGQSSKIMRLNRIIDEAKKQRNYDDLQYLTPIRLKDVNRLSLKHEVLKNRRNQGDKLKNNYDEGIDNLKKRKTETGCLKSKSNSAKLKKNKQNFHENNELVENLKTHTSEHHNSITNDIKTKLNLQKHTMKKYQNEGPKGGHCLIKNDLSKNQEGDNYFDEQYNELISSNQVDVNQGKDMEKYNNDLDRSNNIDVHNDRSDRMSDFEKTNTIDLLKNTGANLENTQERVANEIETNNENHLNYNTHYDQEMANSNDNNNQINEKINNINSVNQREFRFDQCECRTSSSSICSPTPSNCLAKQIVSSSKPKSFCTTTPCPSITTSASCTCPPKWSLFCRKGYSKNRQLINCPICNAQVNEDDYIDAEINEKEFKTDLNKNIKQTKTIEDNVERMENESLNKDDKKETVNMLSKEMQTINNRLEKIMKLIKTYKKTKVREEDKKPIKNKVEIKTDQNYIVKTVKIEDTIKEDFPKNLRESGKNKYSKKPEGQEQKKISKMNENEKNPQN